jgi:hypothetical protein
LCNPRSCDCHFIRYNIAVDIHWGSEVGVPHPLRLHGDGNAVLQQRERIDPRDGQVVALKIFGGLSAGKTPEVRRVSQQTVMREWKMARARPMTELSHS